jgi:hypothetical protein
MQPLEKELETFKKELPTLINDEGKFVLIHGTEIAGTFSSYEDAIKIGYEKFHLEPFLVKQINQIEQVSYFSRDIKLHCPT